MHKVKKFLTLSICFVISMLLTACHSVLLDTKGPIAFDEKRILIISVLLMLTIVVPVIFMTLLFAWRYRASNTKSTYAPNWDNNVLIEIVCWGIPIIIIAILGTITWRSSHSLDPYKPIDSTVKPITIQVVSLEWRWLFIYPEQQIATIDYLQIPVNVPIHFVITAEGPMNSFQIPELGGQIYAMAGMQSQLYYLASETGDFRGISANFNGEGFSSMKFMAKATSLEAFNQWISTVKQSRNPLTITAYQTVSKPNLNNNIQYFSSVSDGLFLDVVMKYMLPMSKLCSTTVSEPTIQNQGKHNA